jgi:hypothetical protein
VTDEPSHHGVPLRAVVALGLFASVLARGVAPALPGLAVGIENAILWTLRLSAFVTLLAATGLVASVARLGAGLIATARAPLLARIFVMPAVGASCLLLLFASFRALDPALSLTLGITAALMGGLAGWGALKTPRLRASALVVLLTAGAGLVHLIARKVALDASAAASISGFRFAQIASTAAALVDAGALLLSLFWLYKKTRYGRLAVGLVFSIAGLCALATLHGSSPSASPLTVLVSRVLDGFSRAPAPLFPAALYHALDAGSLLAAAAALVLGKGELGTVLAAALAARGALDIPLPALLMEVSALYLPFAASLGERADAAQARAGA